jgi:hypothetical protein
MDIIWIVSAKYISDYSIMLTFNDGMHKRVDLKDHLNKPIFEPLRDKKVFAQFSMNAFTIEWDNGADFAPEFLYKIGTPA